MRTFAQHIYLTEASFEKSQRLWLPLAQKILRDSSAPAEYRQALRPFAKQILPPPPAEPEEGQEPEPPVQATLPDEAKKPLEQFFNYVDQEVDPTRGKYTVWLLDRYSKERKQGDESFYGIQRAEDFERARAAIERHNLAVTKRWFQKPENSEFKSYSDINRFKDLPDLENFVRDRVKFEEEEDAGMSDDEKFVRAWEKYKANGGITEIVNADGMRAAILNSREASTELFFNRTNWCTTPPKSRYFDSYMDDGVLVVFYDEKPPSDNLKYAQAHVKERGILIYDKNDRNFDHEKWYKARPPAYEVIRHYMKMSMNPAKGYYNLVNELFPGKTASQEQQREFFLNAVAQSATFSYKYAKHLKQPWPPGEKAIATSPVYAQKYAMEVLRGRFPAGEAAMRERPEVWQEYVAFVKSQGPVSERAIQVPPTIRELKAQKFRNSKEAFRYITGK